MILRFNSGEAELSIEENYMRKVVFRESYGHGLEIDGVFHCFGCDYEEFETGPGNFSTAIIETKDGKLHNIPVELVEFLDVNKIFREK
jgi:hypothetical protein